MNWHLLLMYSICVLDLLLMIVSLVVLDTFPCMFVYHVIYTNGRIYSIQFNSIHFQFSHNSCYVVYMRQIIWVRNQRQISTIKIYTNLWNYIRLLYVHYFMLPRVKLVDTQIKVIWKSTSRLQDNWLEIQCYM